MIFLLILFVALAVILFIVAARKLKGYNAATIFSMEYNAAREKDLDHSKAMFAALKQMQKLTFYNQLSDEDIMLLWFNLSSFDMKYTQGALLAAKRANNIKLLQGAESVNRIADLAADDESRSTGRESL